jgi:hypothetical protein
MGETRSSGFRCKGNVEARFTFYFSIGSQGELWRGMLGQFLLTPAFLGPEVRSMTFLMPL